MKIAVTGANSSVGKNLLAHVVDRGDLQVIAGVRSERVAVSLPSAPQITTRVISYEDVSDLAVTLEGASCLVHLAGILIESRTSTYASANVATTAAVVEASRKAGVKHIVLVSVIGAGANSPNRYLRSKGEAERAVAESGVSSTTVRTPILLGPSTAGAASIVRTAGQGKARLLGGGRYCVRPLDLDDLSRAILEVCNARPEGVRIHELVGPESISYRELVGRVAGMMGAEISIGVMPVWIAKLGAAITSRMNGGGVSPTVIDVITTDEVVERNADTDLGISLTPLTTTLQRILSDKKRET